MKEWEIWLVIFLLIVATGLTRCFFWIAVHHISLPKRVRDALRYAPACALTAIIVPDLLLTNGQIQLDFGNHKLLAAIIALAFYLIKRNMLQTILVGMFCFTMLRLAIGS